MFPIVRGQAGFRYQSDDGSFQDRCGQHNVWRMREAYSICHCRRLAAL